MKDISCEYIDNNQELEQFIEEMLQLMAEVCVEDYLSSSENSLSTRSKKDE
jgi:hypothetical protein